VIGHTRGKKKNRYIVPTAVTSKATTTNNNKQTHKQATETKILTRALANMEVAWPSMFLMGALLAPPPNLPQQLDSMNDHSVLLSFSTGAQHLSTTHEIHLDIVGNADPASA